MPDVPLSPALLVKIMGCFVPADAPMAIAMLQTRCGSDLPLIASQGANGIERVRCAAVKLSGGSLEQLEKVVRTANRDWRDVLVAAGFANDPFLHRVWLADENTSP